MNNYSITYKTTARIHQYVCTNLQKPLHFLSFSFARLTVLLLFLTLACSGVWAQAVTGDFYGTSFTPTGGSAINNTSTITIQHHPAMWYSFRNQLTEDQKKLDTFDDDGQWTTTMNGTQIQAAHVFVDTIYMHKGDTIHLVLPYTDDLEQVETEHTSSFFDLINYFRWFDYKTDGLYNCNLSVTGGTVNDLLTPTQGTETAYRFANGYVSGTFNNTSLSLYPDTRLKFMTFYYPTDAEFSSITTSGFNGGNNDYYLVACDVSSYMDFAPLSTDRSSTRIFPFGTSGYYEPTLSARTIFYIVGVDDVDTSDTDLPEGLQNYMNLLNNSAYQGGGDTENDKYIEEYEITYPNRRLTDYTNELVALSKSAHAYAIPNATADKTNSTNPISLTASVSTTNNTAGIALANTSISGQYRSISFYKSDATLTNGKSAPWQVEDGSTATILVTKTVGTTTYNIARFKITFKEEFTPLTQTQVGGLSTLTDEQKAQYWWGDMTYRSPEYMEENYELLTSITFDYDDDITAEYLYGENTTARREHIYPFPMDWGSSSYSYISGLGADEQWLYPYGYRVTPGEYAIANTYYYDNADLIAQIPVDVGKKTSTGFWVNVDATDAPGTLAILEFGEDLCPASKLYVTAWIKSLNYAGVNSDNGVAEASSSVLLTITGVYPDGSEVPVYRYASSQIRHTNSMPLETYNDGTDIPSSITGVGEGTNNWFQLYFSFINQANTGFDHYALRIDNRSENSSGADYVYDEIKVYVERPEVEMVQLDPICATSEDDKSAMRLDIDYEVMMSRLGFDPEDYTNETDTQTAKTASVDFVIINEAQYRNALAAYEGLTDSDEYKEYQEEAFKDALVIFFDASGNEHQFPTLDFYCNYSLNDEYDDENPGKNIVKFDNNDEGYFFRRIEGSTRYLSVDCLTNMMAYAEYIILLEPHTETEKSSEEKLKEFIQLLDDQCAIKTEFYLSSETILKLNGETIDPTADYCAGQEFVISPEVTYTNPTTGETIYIDGVYFDWFFGSRDEYVANNEDFGGVSLEEALIMFRTYYPDAEELSETETPVTGDDNEQDFTQYHYDIIAYYLEQERYGGMNKMLVLHRSHLDMRVLDIGLELVIQPIEMTFTEENVEICFGYVPLVLYASGDAPTLKAGFNNINYPDNDYEPCLRLGLAQMEKCSESTPFTINLCKATYVTEADENGQTITIDHLGVADGMDLLFLVDTDDPNYRDIILGKGDDEEIVVGKVARLYATSEDGNDPRSDAPSDISGSYMQIYFYGDIDDLDDSGVTPFTVREGYYYVVSVYFQEKGVFDTENNDEPVGSACWGTFPLEIKVVPEYLVWTGDRYDNWNNDNHWRRADKDELNKPSSDAYPTNTENTTDNGFVPMLFSKVIIPRNSEAELYMSGFDEGADGMLSWVGDEEIEGNTPTTNHEDVDEDPEPLNIMYDLMLYENGNGALKTEHYRVNLCDQIHFEPGAQLLHSEQLIYNKAWTDVELSQGPWTLAATPLRDVASGDWYTKKTTGTETAEYFTDINFDSDCDRVSPMVYQRSWSNSGNQIIYNSGTDKTVPAYATTGWSSVYNDVSVAQQAGEGFSIKASNGGTSDLMFRFPKADVSYQYQVGTSSSMTDATTTISRGNAGKLLISGLVDRTDPDSDDDSVYSGEVTVDLTQTSNAYYIIGNPFTAHMSMKEFLAENTQFKGYWLESTYGPIAGNGEYSSWGDEDCLIEPYSAFFVTMDESDLTRADESTTIRFTKDMQKFEDEVEKTSLVAFSVRASSEVGTTGASLSYSEEAIDGYNTIEDAVLMEDATWKKDGMPLVYTVADDMAVSVNKLNALTLVPLGCFADDDLEYTLTFVGVGNLNEPSLYDAYTNTDTPLTEGYTLEMVGETHGRYFIRSKGPSVTGIEEVEDVIYSMSAYSPNAGTIVVSSEAGIETLEVYSLGGILLGKASVGGNMTCTLDGIESGVAIVRACTSVGTFTKKIRVR